MNRRWLRKTLAVMLGLWLGWLAAGWATPGSYASAGGEQGHAATESAHGGRDTAAAGGDAEHHDAGQKSAARLVPDAHDLPWLRPVVTGIAALFIAAVVIGIPALRLRGPEPADPAAHDDHGHDDHGHGDHGHGGGHHEHGHKH